MRLRSLFPLTLLLWVLLGSSAPRARAADGFDHSHSAFNVLLAKHVVDGRVDYAGLDEDRRLLQSYLATLSSLPPAGLARFSLDQRLALHINAYNAFALELVLDHAPIASVQDIARAFERPWFRFVGEPLSLKQLKERRILGQFKEPLLNFALVHAALGSPELRAKAWVPAHIKQELEEAARRFARDPARFELDKQAGILRVSPLFEERWTDFQPRWGGTPLPGGRDEPARHRVVIGFYRDFGDEDTAAYLREHPVRIEYLDFDWRLNEISRD